jgi:hypothetical protein
MKEEPELIMKIGAEGGHFFAYREKDLDGNYIFHFGTSEMGLDFDESGITTRSKEEIKDFTVLLEKIRNQFRNIYNLFPLFVHPDYSKKVLHDLRFRIKDSDFHARDWAMVLFLNANRFENKKFTEIDFDIAETELGKTLEIIDLINTDKNDEFFISQELDKLSQIKPNENTTQKYKSDSYFANLSTEALNNIYQVLVRCNPSGKLSEIKLIERIMVERRKNFEESSYQLANIIGEIHNRYNLFSSVDFKDKNGDNIITALDEFSYLQRFYEFYAAQFDNNSPNEIDRKEARNRDLPFVGAKVIEYAKVDFIFYFMGSLQTEKKLSITVLAHLWTVDEDDIIDKFCGEDKWWLKHLFKNLKDSLAIEKNVIERSYIADAVRFKSNKLNKKLIFEEINFFRPKIVVCVGSVTKDLVKTTRYDFPVRFHHVAFPKYGHGNSEMYNELNQILKNL